jgi:hypothetical protein
VGWGGGESAEVIESMEADSPAGFS